LTVAMADPTSTVAIAEVKFLCGLDVRVAVAGVTAVRETIDRLYGDAPELADALSELGPAAPATDSPGDRSPDEAATAHAPVVRPPTTQPTLPGAPRPRERAPPTPRPPRTPRAPPRASPPPPARPRRRRRRPPPPSPTA